MGNTSGGWKFIFGLKTELAWMFVESEQTRPFCKAFDVKPKNGLTVG